MSVLCIECGIRFTQNAPFTILPRHIWNEQGRQFKASLLSSITQGEPPSVYICTSEIPKTDSVCTWLASDFPKWLPTWLTWVEDGKQTTSKILVSRRKNKQQPFYCCAWKATHPQLLPWRTETGRHLTLFTLSQAKKACSQLRPGLGPSWDLFEEAASWVSRVPR